MAECFSTYGKLANKIKKIFTNKKIFVGNKLTIADIYKYSWFSSHINLIISTAKLCSDIKNSKILLELQNDNIASQSISYGTGFIAVNDIGFLGHKGQTVAFSEARIFSTPGSAYRRFPSSNVFPIEIKINGPMVKHKTGKITKLGKEIDVSLLHKKITEKVDSEIIESNTEVIKRKNKL
jgi:hypothetical protein